MSKDRAFKIFAVIRDTVMVMAISLALLVAFEMTVRLFFPQTTQYTNLKNQSLGMKDSQLGFVYRPNAHQVVKGPEFTAEYKINQVGMRDEKQHEIPKPAGETRILLLGDSFTFGVGANYENIWPAILERNLIKTGLKVSIVKAGVAGYDTRSELLYLKSLLLKYSPEIVVIGFLPNDLFTNESIHNNRVDTEQIAKDFRRDKISSLHSVSLIKRLVMSNDYLYCKLYLLTARKEYFSKPAGERLEQQLSITKDLFLKAHTLCRQNGAKLVVLSIPQQFQVITKARGFTPKGIDTDYIDTVFAEYASQQDFRWIPVLSSLTKEYQQNRKDLYYRLDGHLNNRGNSVVGNYFSTQLVNTLEL